MSPSPPKTRVATIAISVWDEPKQKERGETQTEREHLRSSVSVEIDTEAPILSIEDRLRVAFCAFIDNCQELKGFIRGSEGLLMRPYNKTHSRLPISISVPLLQTNAGKLSLSAEVKGEIHWSDN